MRLTPLIPLSIPPTRPHGEGEILGLRLKASYLPSLMQVADTSRQQRQRKAIYARCLRKRMTRAETVLWGALRNRRCAGLKFRRQAPMEWFVADFLCIDRSLVIEIDGGVHAQQRKYDREREDILHRKRLRVLRFSNEQILHNLQQVLHIIKHSRSIQKST